MLGFELTDACLGSFDGAVVPLDGFLAPGHFVERARLHRRPASTDAPGVTIVSPRLPGVLRRDLVRLFRISERWMALTLASNVMVRSPALNTVLPDAVAVLVG
jgi:hypothetical protein